MNFIRLWLVRAHISWLRGKREHLLALAYEQKSKAQHAINDACDVTERIKQLEVQEMLLVDPRDYLDGEM